MLSKGKSWVPAEALCVGFFITAEKGDHAKREQAALSSLPVRTRWESDCLTSEPYSLGVACTDVHGCACHSQRVAEIACCLA